MKKRFLPLVLLAGTAFGQTPSNTTCGNPQATYYAYGNHFYLCVNGTPQQVDSSGGGATLTPNAVQYGVTTSTTRAANGTDIGVASTNATDDIAIGASVGAPSNPTFPGGNTLFGSNAGHALTLGRGIVAIGNKALFAYQSNTGTPAIEDGLITAVGTQACASLTTGDGDICVGQNSGFSPTHADSSVFVGTHSADNIGTSDRDTFVGITVSGGGTGGVNTSSDNVMMGFQTGYSSSTSTGTRIQNTLLGTQAGFSLGGTSNNTFVGYRSGYGNSGGSGNITGNQNTTIGALNGGNLTTATQNFFGGYNAGNNVTTGSHNIVLGTTGGPSTGSDNVILGNSNTGGVSTGSSNVMIGSFSGQSTGGSSNSVFIGFASGVTANSGSQTYVGYGTGRNATSGTANTALGYQALGFFTSGSNNTAVGDNALAGLTGAESSDIGIGSGANVTAGVSSAAQIGAGTNPTTGTIRYLTHGLCQDNGTSCPGSAPGNAPYTGLVATRGEIAYATTGGNTWEMVRSFHIARSAIAANTMKLVWSNYYVPTSNVETGAGTATYKASVEYPIVFVTGTASSSSTSITVASNAGIVNGMAVTCGTTASSCSTLASNTVVTNVSGTTITIAPATTGSLSTTPIMFSTLTQCTFSGSATSASIAALADVTSDTCGPAIPNGVAFYVRAVRNGASAVIYATDPNNNHYSGTQEGIMFGTGTPTDLTAGGTVTTISGQYNYPPSAIIAPTINPAVCILGDSRAYGGNDVVSDATNDVGEVVRFIGPAFAYIKLTPSGTTAGQVQTNFANRQRLISYCSHAVDEYGINDAGAAIGATTIASSHSTIATMLGIPTFGTTLPTTTTSTDSWLTTTNQTGSGNASIVVTYNALARAGILGEVGVLDIANIVDPYALGVWPVSKIPFATSGTAGFATTDGLHESPLMLQIEAQGLGYTTNWFKR